MTFIRPCRLWLLLKATSDSRSGFNKFLTPGSSEKNADSGSVATPGI